MGLAAITAAGFLLRVLAARGELWLDEIWTLKLLEAVSSWHEIFWNIPHNNNHLLNSLWLWIVGRDAHPIWQRSASILLGTATIPAAAFFIRRRAGEAGAIATALIFAFADIFVQYGSEARGYAGLVLMTVLCADAADGLIAEPQRRAPAFQFALFAALGTFFHLAMVVSIGVLCAATTVSLLPNKARFGDKSLALLRLAVAAVLGALPTIACFYAAASFKGYMVTGVQAPFSFPDLAEGLAGAARSTLGFPGALADVPVIMMTAGLAVAALLVCPPRLRAACVVALLLLPALEIWFQPGNLFFVRFHLPAACFLALLAGAALGIAWAHGGGRKIAAITLASVGLLGHGALMSQLLLAGRDHCADAVARMLSEGPALYDGNLPLETSWVVEFHLERLGKHGLAPTPPGGACETPPDWYVLTKGRNDPDGRDMERFGPAQCRSAFIKVAHYPAGRLSGLDWTLYRLSPQPPGLDQTLITR